MSVKLIVHGMSMFVIYGSTQVFRGRSALCERAHYGPLLGMESQTTEVELNTWGLC